MSSLLKFNRKKRLIHLFEQPRPKLSMQLDRSVKNISCYLILRHATPPPRLCASARDNTSTTDSLFLNIPLDGCEKSVSVLLIATPPF